MKLKNKKRLLGLGAMLGSVFVGQYRVNMENDYLYFLYTISVIALFVWGFFVTLFNELEN